MKGFTDVTPELRAQMRASLVDSDDTRTLCGVRFVDLLDALDATYCAYCGHRVERDDEAATKISSHIATCPRHPMRDVEAERDALQARLTATLAMVAGRLAGGCHELNYLQRVDILCAIEKAAHRLVLALGPVTEPTFLVKALNDMLLALDARPS